MNAESADGLSSIHGVAGKSGNVRGILQCRDELRQRGDRRNRCLRCGKAKNVLKCRAVANVEEFGREEAGDGDTSVNGYDKNSSTQ
jgi:hypothetical protein